MYNEINSDFFGNELPSVIFTVDNLKDELASTYTFLDNIFINFSTHDTYNIFEVMAHEMIHVWQIVNNDTSKAHGKTFKQLAKDLNDFYNLDIAKSQFIE